MKRLIILLGLLSITLVSVTSCDIYIEDEEEGFDWRCPYCGCINRFHDRWCRNCGWGY